MKLRLCIMLLLLGMGASAFDAFDPDMTVKQYRDAFREGADPLERRMAETYITGIGRAFLWASVYLESRNRQALYCPPARLVLRFANYQNMIDWQITKLAKVTTQEKLEGDHVALILLDSLMETFPCSNPGK